MRGFRASVTHSSEDRTLRSFFLGSATTQARNPQCRQRAGFSGVEPCRFCSGRIIASIGCPHFMHLKATYLVSRTPFVSSEPAIADGFLNRWEASKVSDLQGPGQRGNWTHAGNGPQPLQSLRQQRISLQRGDQCIVQPLPAFDRLPAQLQQWPDTFRNTWLAILCKRSDDHFADLRSLRRRTTVMGYLGSTMGLKQRRVEYCHPKVNGLTLANSARTMGNTRMAHKVRFESVSGLGLQENPRLSG